MRPKISRYVAYLQALIRVAEIGVCGQRLQRCFELFAEALVRGGFNPGNAEQGGRAGFANYLAEIIVQVRSRITCPIK